MRRIWILSLAVWVAVASVWSMGCGGAGAEGGASGTVPGAIATVLAWDPPTTYVDATPLNPLTDLTHYEFYIRQDPSFTEADSHMAEVNAVDNQVLVSEFNLGNLLPFLPPGPRVYLSIRAVGSDGSKSPFSQPIAWDHT